MSVLNRAVARRSTIGLVAAVSAVTLAFGAGAAHADPGPPPPAPVFRALPGAGGDTLPDFGDGLAEVAVIGGVKVLGSYRPTGSATIQTRPGGVFFPRPSDSGQGIAALSAAISGGADTFRSATLNYEDVQWAFSSSGPGALQSNTGALEYIPLAIDAVSYATIDNTVIPSGVPLGTAAQDGWGTAAAPEALTLRNIYQGGNQYIQGVIGTTTYKFYVGTGTPAAGFTKLDVYVPRLGSGTRSYWGTVLGFSTWTGQLPAGVRDSYGSQDIQDDDGSPLVGNPRAIMPFSIAQYISQGNAATLSTTYGISMTDRRHGALLNNVRNAAGTSIAPKTLGGLVNTGFPIVRPVFTVVEHAAIDTSSPLYNADLATVFKNTTGLAYTSTKLTDFGFAKLANGGTTINGVTYVPGSTVASLRSNPTYIH